MDISKVVKIDNTHLQFVFLHTEVLQLLVELLPEPNKTGIIHKQ